MADLKGKDQNCLPSSIRKAVIERMIRILVSSETNVIVVCHTKCEADLPLEQAPIVAVQDEDGANFVGHRLLSLR